MAEPAKTSEVIPLIDNEVPLNEISVSAQPQEASESLQIDIADAGDFLIFESNFWAVTV